MFDNNYHIQKLISTNTNKSSINKEIYYLAFREIHYKNARRVEIII